MKNLFRNIFLVSCLLLTVGAVEAQAQTAQTPVTKSLDMPKASPSNRPIKKVVATQSDRNLQVNEQSVPVSSQRVDASEPDQVKPGSNELTAQEIETNRRVEFLKRDVLLNTSGSGKTSCSGHKDALNFLINSGKLSPSELAIAQQKLNN